MTTEETEIADRRRDGDRGDTENTENRRRGTIRNGERRRKDCLAVQERVGKGPLEGIRLPKKAEERKERHLRCI